MNLAQYAKRVVVVVRGHSLEEAMSLYLVARIRATANIEVRLRSEVTEARGDGHLEAVTLTDRDSGTDEDVAVNWLFVFIGASPHTTGWALRSPGTPRDSSSPGRTCWPSRPQHGPSPDLRSRSRPASPASSLRGDVRLDSMKRVASAVGEGAMSVYLVHRYLATM